MSAPRLYLDNAATSFPKPACVHEAMVHYMTRVGGTAGRGTYAEAREGARVIATCRQRICEFIHGENPDHVVFTLNTSDALNLAINGVVAQRRLDSPGRPVHLVTTALDHNSVLRPYTAHTDTGAEWTCVPIDPDTGVCDPARIKSALRPDTALVAINHASNVTGAIQPAAEIGAICGEQGVLFLLDAAQSLGHIDVDVRALNADLLAIPGHKGLLGPLGTGALYLRPGVEKLVRPVRVGGTGSRSESEQHPTLMPDRYEPGSQNAVGIAGLSEAIAWLLERRGTVFAHDRELRALMLEGLRSLDAFGARAGSRGLRLFGPTDPEQRVGVFSLSVDSLSPAEGAAVLEQEFGILCRAGLHCAPRAHASLGTAATGGSVRLSIGPFVRREDISRVIDALGALAGSVADSGPPTRAGDARTFTIPH